MREEARLGKRPGKPDVVDSGAEGGESDNDKRSPQKGRDLKSRITLPKDVNCETNCN